MADIFEIAGRIHSTSQEEVTTVANEILDTAKNKKQDEINTETYSLVNDINERLSGLNPEQQGALSVAAKATNNETKLGYYVCGTEGNVAAKVISDATGYVLSTGGSIKVKMTNANTANNATLNINSTGAKPLYYDGERASANNTWEAGETVEVYYDGTNFYANNVAGSGGDGVFDVSEKYPTSGVEGGNTYTLDGALAVLNANLPASKKKGGMSVKFVQSSDNKYVQYRLMADSFNTTEANWQGVDDVPTAGSNNLVNSGGVAEKLSELELEVTSITGKKYDVSPNGKKQNFGLTTNGDIIRADYVNLDTTYHPIHKGIELKYRLRTTSANTPIICFYQDKNVESYVGRIDATGDYQEGRFIVEDENYKYFRFCTNDNADNYLIVFGEIDKINNELKLKEDVVITGDKALYSIKDYDGNILFSIDLNGVVNIPFLRNKVVDFLQKIISANKRNGFLCVTEDAEGNIVEGIDDNGRQFISLPSNQDIRILDIIGKKEKKEELMALINSYRYLVLSFSNASAMNVDLLGTNDLVNFTTIKQAVYTPTLGKPNGGPITARDPSIALYNGYYYITYTTSGYYTYDEGNVVIGMCRTKNFTDFEELPLLHVALEDSSYRFNVAWAPAFCFDKYTGVMYIVLSACFLTDSGTIDRKACIHEYDFETHTLGVGMITDIEQIDAHFVCENDTYYMFANGVTLYKSSDNLLGRNWDLITNINTEYSGAIGEAPFAIKMDDGKWRVWANGTGSIPSTRFPDTGFGRMYYSDTLTDDIEGAWTEKKEINYPKVGLTQPTHWTILDNYKKTF